jgi:hypothetical protein
MKTYSAKDRAEIAAMYPGTCCRVSNLRHTHSDRYTGEGNRAFTTEQDALDYCAELGGAECDLPEYYGDIAFSADGKQIRILTRYPVAP